MTGRDGEGRETWQLKELEMRKSGGKCVSPVKDGESEHTAEVNAMAAV